MTSKNKGYSTENYFKIYFFFEKNGCVRNKIAALVIRDKFI